MDRKDPQPNVSFSPTRVLFKTHGLLLGYDGMRLNLETPIAVIKSTTDAVVLTDMAEAAKLSKPEGKPCVLAYRNRDDVVKVVRKGICTIQEDGTATACFELEHANAVSPDLSDLADKICQGGGDGKYASYVRAMLKLDEA